MKCRKLAGLIAVTAVLAFGTSHATTFQVDSNESLVKTTLTNYPTWINDPEELDFVLTGEFDLSTAPGGTTLFYSYPATIALTNISVPTAFGNRHWTFPGYRGVINEGGAVIGSSNFCFLFQGPGSCYSSGPFDNYAGIFDGDNLTIDGAFGGIVSPSSGLNLYSFHLVAHAVPEPAPVALLCFGLVAIVLLARRVTCASSSSHCNRKESP